MNCGASLWFGQRTALYINKSLIIVGFELLLLCRRVRGTPLDRIKNTPLFRTHEILAEFRWCTEGAARPSVAPRTPARAPRTTRAYIWRAFPPKHPAQPPRPRCGLPRAAQAAGKGYFFASVRGSPHPTGLLTQPMRVRLYLGALASCAVRERQVARPVSRRRAARPTGLPIARNCGAR